MVINREFFFRGWLPAGLVLNARLNESSPGDNFPVLKPVINPTPGRSWPEKQPSPIFPVEQATDEQAILLADSFPEGALVMLPLGGWYGKGTPCILATNTWYEGRIQLVTGADVMAVRLLPIQRRAYFTSAEEAAKPDGVPDVTVVAMASYYIPGRTRYQALFVDESESTMTELGYPPMIGPSDSQMPARVMDYFSVTQIHVAGLRGAYEKENPSTELRYIQCSVVDGSMASIDSQSYAYIGLIPISTWVVQAFYSVQLNVITASKQLKNLLDPDSEEVLAVVANGSAGSDQVVHYN